METSLVCTDCQTRMRNFATVHCTDVVGEYFKCYSCGAEATVNQSQLRNGKRNTTVVWEIEGVRETKNKEGTK